MAGPSSAVMKRTANDMALMPPPPLKRIKRPPKVLDEDDYTSALSEIIARDYFPGLHETQAQQEYLTALESNNDAWIAEAGQQLREAMTPLPASKQRRSTRSTRFDNPGATPRLNGSATPVAETPARWDGGETPASVTSTEKFDASVPKPAIETSTLSLSSFQAKYTSEDNESFNELLDEQNEKRRDKHRYLWTQENKAPTPRQILYREKQARLLKEAAEDAADGKALIPITTGAIDSRPAKPDAWIRKDPDNPFMFNAVSVDEDGLETVAEIREAVSKAGPKHVVHKNTRFPIQALAEAGLVPRSPSLNTTIIAHRDAARDARSETEYSGGETPRVNGYAFVDEDDAENLATEAGSTTGPSYRDLLAGQVGDAVPNPFKLSENRKREELHLRLVEKDNKKNRLKVEERQKSATVPGTPVANMTPAARKLMGKIGKTPTRTTDAKREELWTPARTPRRKVK